MYRENRRAFLLIVSLMTGLFSAVTPNIAEAQGKAKNNKAAPEDAEPVMTSRDFGGGGLDLSTDATVEDQDATFEGRQRLQELESTAKRIYFAKKEVDRKRQPLAGPRDVLVGQSMQAAAQLNGAQQAAASANQTIAQCNRQLQITSGDVAKQLNNKKNAAQALLGNANNNARQANAVIGANQPQINALNAQLKPLDDQLQQLWNELEECRKQWVEIRQPVDKYSRGDFERLRKVLDDWLLIDGLWPQAHSWGALCAYELEDYAAALDYVEKADEIRVNVFRARVQWPELAALYGLIGRKLPGQSVKANKSLAEALKLIDRNVHVEAYFLLARCYSERPEEHLKAKANFENSLKLRPNYVCAQLGLARLQATSNNDKVRDQVAGTKTLERLWAKTGKRSWRVAYYLVEAYDASRQPNEAAKYWQIVMDSDAPAEWKEKIAKERQKA